MHNNYKIRSAFVFLFFVIVYCIIIFNLYLIQIKNHAFFTNLGNKQYTVMVTTAPPRAPIYDRSGKHFLAMNKDSVSAFILPKVMTNKKGVEQFLRKHFPPAYDRLHQSSAQHFMYVARRLTPAQIDQIQRSGLEDIQLLNEPGRFYPVESAGQLIGITDIDNKGLFGLEFLWQKKLAGTPTTRSLQKDARSNRYYFSKETMVDGEYGTPIITSIDSNLQFLAYEELKKAIDNCQAQEGSVIIMNPQNGEILAIANYPLFDPNDTKALDLEQTKNRVISQAYELGSVIKVFSCMASLDEGIVTPTDMIDCENVKTTYIDGRKINTVPSSVAGIVPFSKVIEKSNNIGIAKVVKQVGSTLYDHYKRLGFGEKTGVEFPTEHEGFVNPPRNWSKHSIFSLSYGYEITATLLQLARAFSIIANGGYAIKPTLLLTHKDQIFGPRVYKKETIETMKNILEGTVIQGSAKKARIAGYRIMGKTGTANMLINGHYEPSKNIYTFAGIVEKDGYQRVIVTFIKEIPKQNVYASTIAAPLFERIAEKTLIHDKIIA